VLEFLSGLPGPVRAVYEAGPCGYVLHRQGAARGLEVAVCAPALTPRAPGRRRKTDAGDAERLARLLLSGDLRMVGVPSPEREQLRDLVRAREDLRQDLARARGRLRALLLRRGIRYPGPGRTGTPAHRAWLARLGFGDLASQATLDDYRAAIEDLERRRAVLEAAVSELASAEPFAQTVRRLRAFRGIDTLSAVGLVAEVGEFGRFARPAQLADYLGLVPSEHSSGERRRLGGITKAGPPNARRLLIEAAWHYRHRPSVGRSLAQRQVGVDPRVVAIAARAQRRLHARAQRMGIERRRPAEVVTVACARELSGYLWEAATL
jgi:transposase